MINNDSIYDFISKPILVFEKNLNEIFKKYFDINKNLFIEIADSNEIHFGPLIIKMNFFDNKNNDIIDIQFANIAFRVSEDKLLLIPSKLKYYNNERNNYLNKDDNNFKDNYLKIINEFTSIQFNRLSFYKELTSAYKIFISDVLEILKLDLKFLLDDFHFSEINTVNKNSSFDDITLIVGKIDYSFNSRKLSGDHDYDFDHIFTTEFNFNYNNNLDDEFLKGINQKIKSLNFLYKYSEKDCLKSEVNYVEGIDYISEYYSFKLSNLFNNSQFKYKEILEREIRLKEIYKKQEAQRKEAQRKEENKFRDDLNSKPSKESKNNVYKKLSGKNFNNKKIDLSQFSNNNNSLNIQQINSKSIEKNTNQQSVHEIELKKFEDLLNKIYTENNSNYEFISNDYDNSIKLYNKILVIYFIVKNGLFSFIELLNEQNVSRKDIYSFIFNVYCFLSLESYKTSEIDYFFKLRQENKLYHSFNTYNHFKLFDNEEFINYLLKYIPNYKLIKVIDNHQFIISSIFKLLIYYRLDGSDNSKLFSIVSNFVYKK